MKPAYWIERMSEYKAHGTHVIPAVLSRGRPGRRVGPVTEYLNPTPDEMDVEVTRWWAPLNRPSWLQGIRDVAVYRSPLPPWRRALFAIATQLIRWATRAY